ncbi:integrase [Peribacillus frigoritolerans]|uniref:integrase n=1 Tax=Peribacillus frigoritolerans TaxID=450367 RepID=UPI003ED01CEA
MNSQKFLTKGNYIDIVSIDKNAFKHTPKQIDEYKKIFIKWVDLNIIKNSSYEDKKWILSDRDCNSRRLIFDLQDHKFNTSLKCFALSIIEQEFSINYIEQVISCVHESIEVTEGFNINYLSDLEDYIEKHNYAKRNNLATYTILFLSFTQINFSEEFADVCTPFINNIQRSRDLPNYQHILFFDEKINHFLEESNTFERQKYFPIVLWWKLTTLIPMRPKEFLKIKKDCIVKKTDDIFEITIPREKQKATLRRDIEVTDTLRINKETYNLIKEFQKYDLLNHQYLFTIEYYKNHKEFFGSELSKDTEFLPKRQLDSLLDQFYKYILIKKYNYSENEKISLGDTRHFAFCNMMLQGFNMLSIARIGGHTRLDKQQHYWGHLKYFSESWVYNLAEKNRRLEFLNTSLPDASFVEEKRKIINEYKLSKEENFEEYLPVDYGYCLDYNFPNNCSGDCRHCSFYKFHPNTEELNDGINWLNNFSHTLSRKINEQISLLTYISQNVKYDLECLTFSITDQEELSYTSNELNRLLHQKSIIDSKLPKKAED